METVEVAAGDVYVQPLRDPGLVVTVKDVVGKYATCTVESWAEGETNARWRRENRQVPCRELVGPTFQKRTET